MSAQQTRTHTDVSTTVYGTVNASCDKIVRCIQDVNLQKSWDPRYAVSLVVCFVCGGACFVRGGVWRCVAVCDSVCFVFVGVCSLWWCVFCVWQCLLYVSVCFLLAECCGVAVCVLCVAV